MMTKLEAILCGLLIVLLFLIGHALTTAFLPKSETRSVPARFSQIASTPVVHSSEAGSSMTHSPTERIGPAAHIGRRVDLSYEPTSSESESDSTDTTDVTDPVALAAPSGDC